MFGGEHVRYHPSPTYLGVTLDRSITYFQHLTRTAHEIKSRNYIIHKLAGTTWGVDGDTLRKVSLYGIETVIHIGLILN